MPRWKDQPAPETYVPEKPCSRCGTSLRYKKSWNCIECHKRRDRRVTKEKAIKSQKSIA